MVGTMMQGKVHLLANVTMKEMKESFLVDMNKAYRGKLLRSSECLTPLERMEDKSSFSG